MDGVDVYPIAERAPVLKPLPLKDLLDAFGDCPAAMTAVNSNIRKLKVTVDNAERIKWEYQYKYGGFTAVFLSMMIDYMFPGGAHSLEAAQLKALRRFRDCVKARDKGDSMTADVERARAVPITELIECKRKGCRWWGLCPFHADTRPSLLINKDNTYKCFVCGAGRGDVIDFVMKRDRLTFIEAVRYLCKT